MFNTQQDPSQLMDKNQKLQNRFDSLRRQLQEHDQSVEARLPRPFYALTMSLLALQLTDRTPNSPYAFANTMTLVMTHDKLREGRITKVAARIIRKSLDQQPKPVKLAYIDEALDRTSPGESIMPSIVAIMSSEQAEIDKAEYDRLSGNSQNTSAMLTLSSESRPSES